MVALGEADGVASEFFAIPDGVFPSEVQAARALLGVFVDDRWRVEPSAWSADDVAVDPAEFIVEGTVSHLIEGRIPPTRDAAIAGGIRARTAGIDFTHFVAHSNIRVLERFIEHGNRQTVVVFVREILPPLLPIHQAGDANAELAFDQHAFDIEVETIAAKGSDGEFHRVSRG